MFYLIKHGEATDSVPDDIRETARMGTLPFDAPQTLKGEEQAYKTGAFLKRELLRRREKNNNLKILILTSPMFKCLQTSAQIVKAVGIENIWEKNIFIEDAFENHYNDLYHQIKSTSKNFIEFEFFKISIISK